MKKYINIKNSIIGVAVVVLLGLLPSSASAATVYLEASRNTISVGDTAIISVRINADAAILNSVEGEILLKPSTTNLAIQEFSLANSSFGLWPRTPSLSKDAHLVSFVGGVPGGFSIEGATMFKIIVEAKKEGIVTVSPQNISVYANDGKGTKIPVQLKDIVINVVAKKAGVAVNNEWQSVVSQDKVAPEDFIIVFGKDADLFGGKKFAFFSAVDNQTGIDHYDVSENGGTLVRSGSTYVLQDQSDNVKLNVIAYDKSGNTKTAIYPVKGTEQATSMNTPWTYIIVVILVLIAIIFVLIKKSKKNKSGTPVNRVNNTSTDVPTDIKK